MGLGIWTDERVADLKRLWEKGYSCSQIAVEMNCGLTRNAIIGKAHRLKLSSHSRARNFNGQSRAINPKPPGEPRKPGTRPRICSTVYKSRERKPDNKIFNKPATPGMIVKMSILTGNVISVPGFRRQRAPEMTKDELRAMLAGAAINTAAMEIAE